MKIGERTRSYEDEFLHAVERKAGRMASGYSQRVKRRLTMGAREYGDDNYLHIGVLKMLQEIRFEAEDLSGYSTLLSQALQREEFEGLEPDASYRMQLLLQSIAMYGALTDALIDEAEETYKTAKKL